MKSIKFKVAEVEESFNDFNPVKKHYVKKYSKMRTEQMLSKCKTLKEKEIRRKNTFQYTKDFNPYKLDALKTVNLSKVFTQHTT